MVESQDPNEPVIIQGDPWELPRPIAESIRRMLERYGLPSVLRTPWQWVQATPVIELETGGFMGMVGLYVPEVMKAQALEVLEESGVLETEILESEILETGVLESESLGSDVLEPEASD
jgi:hypothetical protein